MPRQLPTPPPAALGQLDSALLSEHLAHWSRVLPEQTALTFADYATDRAGVLHELDYAELDARVTALARAVERTAGRGERVAVLAPQGL